MRVGNLLGSSLCHKPTCTLRHSEWYPYRRLDARPVGRGIARPPPCAGLVALYKRRPTRTRHPQLLMTLAALPPTETVGNVSTSPLQSFVQVAIRIVAIHQSRSHIHCQSFHNFIAHLRLRLDANIRSACFIAHMCTCIPSFLGFSETNILFTRVELRHCIATK
jgi:hypothetical protein